MIQFWILDLGFEIDIIIYPMIMGRLKILLSSQPNNMD